MRDRRKCKIPTREEWGIRYQLDLRTNCFPKAWSYNFRFVSGGCAKATTPTPAAVRAVAIPAMMLSAVEVAALS